MEKSIRILHCINKNGYQNQRTLAKDTGLSLGGVNIFLKSLLQDEYLQRIGRRYSLTKQGESYLEEYQKRGQEDKLLLKSYTSKVRVAVILAAGDCQDFAVPTGLLKVRDVPIIEYSIRYLRQAGIEKIYVVVGAKEEQYRTYFKGRDITLVSNYHYKWSGTMKSLECVKDIIKEDFLLVESNLIYEEVAIEALCASVYESCILLVAPSGSGDDAYVELGKDKTLFRISKDISQLNHIDGEMVGLCKISYALFQKMLTYYADNTNPMLNHESVIENIGRLYHIHGVFVDDLVWTVIENKKLYRQAEKIIYPRMRKKVKVKAENQAREVLKKCMNLKDEEIREVSVSGGMTNTNFFVSFKGEDYVLRIPGAGTDEIMNRKNEKINAMAASERGINPETIYFDENTGIKITRYIKGAITLNGKMAKLENILKKTTTILRQLHQSDMKMNNVYSVEEEYNRFKANTKTEKIDYYEGFQTMDDYFYKIMQRLKEIGLEKAPCHIDPAAVNFVEDEGGRMYLIDWEYSGYNDPAWDFATHFLENEFEQDDEELFLSYYFPEGVSTEVLEKILLFKMSQDILWSVWTIVREESGEDFGAYGQDRFDRAKKLKETYEKAYGKL